jgi:ribosomal protein S18 acetylase RimI-like enzyme
MRPDDLAPVPPPDLAPQDVVLRFLESTGRPSEARLYLELFRARPREQFAALAIDANVMSGAADAVVQDLRFLAALDLYPTVVLGIFQPADAAAHARVLTRHLEAEGVAVETLPAVEAGLGARVTAAAAAGRVPAVVFEPAAGEQPDDRLARLGVLLRELQTRKLLFLNRPGGLRRDGELVPLVNLSTDVPALAESKEISRKEALILEGARRLCEEAAPLPFTVAITSPLNVLRELFTVKGAGTLLRRGARIVRRDGWDGVDLARLRDLLASSFGRATREDFFRTAPSRVYLDADYRGCAILVDTPLGAYLTKFAVSPEVQGEGIARDLWEVLTTDTPVVFWRARRANPIRDWYDKLCDGLARLPEWTVYWKGLAAEAIPAVIDWTVKQPIDIPRAGE